MYHYDGQVNKGYQSTTKVLLKLLWLQMTAGVILTSGVLPPYTCQVQSVIVDDDCTKRAGSQLYNMHYDFNETFVFDGGQELVNVTFRFNSFDFNNTFTIM